MTWQINPAVIQQVGGIIAAGYPVILIETWEEERLEKILSIATAEGQACLRTWSSSRGFDGEPGGDSGFRDPLKALEFVRDNGANTVFVMRDLPAYLQASPAAKRAIRDIFDCFPKNRSALVMSHPGAALPEDLRKEVYFLKLPLPDRAELESYLKMLNTELSASQKFSAEWIEHCAAEMLSFTTNESALLFRRLLAKEVRDLDVARAVIREQRAQTLLKESCLEVVDIDLDLDSIGGLANLKKWIVSRHRLFGLEAQRAGIAPPSGMLMMGVSGCGKSMAAKVLASAWKLPLIRLDMNLIMSGAWGSPELAWARALASIESVAPVVVWLDEIENSFGYVNGENTGGNLTIFSSFLTWMQEKTQHVFVVATANNIDLLPAEMLRKGRFDELFFLDLPKVKAREEILTIHVTVNGGDAARFDLKKLAELLDGWTAAEIEQLIRAAKLAAFYENREFNDSDLKNISFEMVPLSKTMSEQINELRRWARARAVPAD